ncbi:hypothetical protein [Rubritalea sp.]|uniref:hypothetical protein n=1 Tax=Rubritalea sp. TaxID=2109375 RepID=UPI0032421CC5
MAFNIPVDTNQAFDLKKEPQDNHEIYGTQSAKELFTNNFFLARRLYRTWSPLHPTP